MFDRLGGIMQQAFATDQPKPFTFSASIFKVLTGFLPFAADTPTTRYLSRKLARTPASGSFAVSIPGVPVTVVRSDWSKLRSMHMLGEHRFYSDHRFVGVAVGFGRGRADIWCLSARRRHAPAHVQE